MSKDNLLPEKISPEGLTVAECYLENKQDATIVASKLNMPIEEVRRYLATPEVRQFTLAAFNESGLRNREKLFSLMDQIISDKIVEMSESETTSSMDIMDMLSKYHKMHMDVLKQEQLMMETKGKISNQTNVQINSGGSNFDALISKLVK